MKTGIKILVFGLALSGLVSCTKNVNLDLPNPPQLLVVEGHIEPNQQAYLYLSHNFAFFGSTTIASILSQDVVHGAKITVSDGTTTDTMREILPSIGYYQSITLKGQIGKTYSLKVVAMGQTLTSSTTILQPIKLDSAWFQVQPGLDTLGYMWAILNDPPQPGNCYRWLAERIGKDTTFIPPEYSVFNDQFINGQKFEFYYDRGIFPGSKAMDDTDNERHYFKTGEKVVIKFCAIDNTAYQFYNLYYFQLSNNGNPFGSPAPLPGNINGGLGIWCAYGSYLDTVLCK
jgi:hypothetical protein